MANSLDDHVFRWLTTVAGLQTSADETGLGPPKRDAIGASLALFDVLVTHAELQAATRSLFKNGHFAESVRQGFVCLDNAVRSKAGSSLTGNKLMRMAFSANNPKLQLNSLKSVSDQDEQRGYMELYAGAMTGIRNPRAHEVAIKDDAETAIELLALANHLMRRLDAARVAAP